MGNEQLFYRSTGLKKADTNYETRKTVEKKATAVDYGILQTRGLGTILNSRREALTDK